MYFVYLLLSTKYNKTYTGITTDINKRLMQHNRGNPTFTKRYKPWKLIYKEEFQNRSLAYKKEKYFKSVTGRRWIKNNIFNADVAELVYAQP